MILAPGADATLGGIYTKAAARSAEYLHLCPPLGGFEITPTPSSRIRPKQGLETEVIWLHGGV